MKKRKNILKKASFLIIALCVILCACPFLLNNFSYLRNSSVSAETIVEETNSYLVDELELETVFNDISVSIPTYSFTYSDLSTIIQNGNEHSCFYTNKAVTISTTSNFTNNDSFKVTIKNEQGTDITGVCEKTIGDSLLYSLTPADSIDTLYHIQIELQKYIPPVGNKKPMTLTTSVSFYVLQTFVDFYANSQIKWAYEQNGLTYNITEPSNGKQYNSSLRAFLPGGSKYNPIYLNFEYLGQKYSIYKIGNIFYNAIDNSEIDISYINFSKSGIYNVSIHDKTYIPNSLGNPSNNHQKYSFIVKNSSSPFYIVATDEQNNMIADGEYTNSTVKLDFCNIENIFDQISSIEVSRSYSPSSGINIPETTTYHKSQIESEFELIFDQSGTYHVYVKDNTKNKNTIYSYIVIVLKDIMTSFTIGQETYSVDKSVKVNQTKTETINLTKEFTFNGIKSSTPFTFNIFLANSSPSIAGIENNARTSDPVSLKVYGVGNISVKITHNGQTKPTIIKTNGQALETITEQGKYFVQITDQMGNTRNVTFNITIQLNTASLVLIGVAAAAVVGLFIFLIISRTKFKVR